VACLPRSSRTREVKRSKSGGHGVPKTCLTAAYFADFTDSGPKATGSALLRRPSAARARPCPPDAPKVRLPYGGRAQARGSILLASPEAVPYSWGCCQILRTMNETAPGDDEAIEHCSFVRGRGAPGAQANLTLGFRRGATGASSAEGGAGTTSTMIKLLAGR